MKSSIKILFLLLITVATLCLVSCGKGGLELPNESDAEQNQENAEDDGAGLEGENPSECTHEYEEKILIPATCQKEGITKKTCKLCNSSETISTPKAAHTEVIDKGIPATCTSAGISDGKHCSVCNAITKKQEAVAALGHTEVIDAAVAATCTTPGKTEGKHCKTCNLELVKQEVVTASHDIKKRTYAKVTCEDNGSVELYCAKCQNVLGYETILKGHYFVDHEYAQITQPEIGDLCKGFNYGDVCEYCNKVFIAPGKYTITGNLLNNGNGFTTLEKWTGEEEFTFDYYDSEGVLRHANKFKIFVEDYQYYLQIDDTVISDDHNERFGSLVINITEPYFAEVSWDFYTIVFLHYFEQGEYSLSGKYTWNDNFPMYIDVEQKINFTYSIKDHSDKKTGTTITVDYLIATGDPYLSKHVVRYDTLTEAAIYFISDPGTEFYFDVENEIDFGETPQTVSKEFFEWFTITAEKQAD